MSLQELVEWGSRESPFFVLNEAHDGYDVCVRTRRVGKQLLPHFHRQGFRLLALEAANPLLCQVANRERQLPNDLLYGYTKDPEMRDFMQTALDLGWDLVSYDDQHSEISANFFWMVEIDPKVLMTPRYLRFRERAQAQNIVRAWRQRGSPKTVVWCGNGHGSLRVRKLTLGHEFEYRPMGLMLWREAGVKPVHGHSDAYR